MSRYRLISVPSIVTDVATMATLSAVAAVLVRNDRSLLSLQRVECCTLFHQMTMLVPQAHLPASRPAQKRLFMAAWDNFTAKENGNKNPFYS